MHQRRDRFFKNEDFEFMIELALGATYYRGADIGECLSTAARIKDGDAESWFEQWSATADRIAEAARGAEEAGHRVSARDAWLRAATYYDTATFFLDSTDDPERMRADLGAAPRRLGGLRAPPSAGDRARRDPLRGDRARGLPVPGDGRPGAAAAADPQQRLRRPGLGDVAAGGRGRPRSRLRLPHLRRPRPGRGAVAAGSLLPARLGGGDHAGCRLRARPRRDRSGAHRPARRQPGRLLGSPGRRLREADRGGGRRSRRLGRRRLLVRRTSRAR